VSAGQASSKVAEKPEVKVKVCYNCGEPGHQSAECSKPRTGGKFKGKSRENKTCANCGEKGHMSFECTKDVSKRHIQRQCGSKSARKKDGSMRWFPA
jgi:hypothetical protein